MVAKHTDCIGIAGISESEAVVQDVKVSLIFFPGKKQNHSYVLTKIYKFSSSQNTDNSF